jgi:hypothetical protein
MANQIRPGRDLRFATVSADFEGTTAIQDTIAKGVSAGEIAYVGKSTADKYSPLSLPLAEVKALGECRLLPGGLLWHRNQLSPH